MRKVIISAGVLLVLQLVLVVVANMNRDGFEPYSPNTALVDFTPDKVDTIRIDSGDDGQQLLVKTTDGWVLKGEMEIPADAQLVKAFIAKLASFKRGLAVGTTREAAQRFKVADNDFASHVELLAGGDVLADLYFGTSPGFKQLHTRTAKTTEVVTVSLGSHEVTAAEEQWMAKDLLQVDKDSIAQVDFSNFSLSRQDTQWSFVDKSDPVNQKEADALIDALTSLSYQRIVPRAGTGSGGDAGMPEGADIDTVSLHLEDTTQLTYTFSSAGEQEYRVSRSDYPFAFVISKWQRDELVGKDAASLADGEQIAIGAQAEGSAGSAAGDTSQ